MPTHVPCGLPSCAAPPALQMMCQSWAETHPAYYAGLLDLTACTGDKTTVKGCSAAVNFADVPLRVAKPHLLAADVRSFPSANVNSACLCPYRAVAVGRRPERWPCQHALQGKPT